MNHIKNVSIYCGTTDTLKKTTLSEYQKLISNFTKSDYHLIFGGKANDTLKKLAASSVELGAQVTTIFPYSMKDADSSALKAIRGARHLYAETRSAALDKLFDSSDAYVFLQGGYDVLDSLMRLIEKESSKSSKFPHYAYKPILVCNIGGLYDGIKQSLDAMSSEGYISSEQRNLVRFVGSTEEVVDVLHTLNSMPPVELGVFASGSR